MSVNPVPGATPPFGGQPVECEMALTQLSTATSI
jgi:hypothetical protein